MAKDKRKPYVGPVKTVRKLAKKPIAVSITPWGSIGDGNVNLTGSSYLVAVKYDDGTEYRFILDCGIFQGANSSEANRAPFPMEPSKIHLAILTHGHADHCARLPLFVKNGYSGQVWASELTCQVAKLSLEDSAKLMMKQFEADQANYVGKITQAKTAIKTVAESKQKGVKRDSGGSRVVASDHRKATPAEVAKAEELLKGYGIEKSSEIPKVFDSKRPEEPLYLPEDAVEASARFKTQNQNVWIPLPGAPGVAIQFFDACHVLGSTSVAIRVHGIGEGREKSKTFVFSGDLGPTREFQPHGTGVAKIPENVHPDLIFVESTYGGRRHYDGKEGRPSCWNDVVTRLEATVKDAVLKRDILILPAFALDRAQLVMHLLVNLRQQGVFDGELYLDSPLTAKYMKLYQKHLPAYSKTLRAGPKTYKVLEKNDREIALAKPGFKIVVTCSGMGTGGPVGEYFKRYLEQPRAEFTFTGYMAEGTPGRDLTEGVKLITLPEIGASFEVRAKIGRIDGLSSHKDEGMIRKWCGLESPKGSGKAKLRFPNVRVGLVHGESRTSIPAMKHAFERRLFPSHQILTPQVGVPVEL